MTEKHLTNQKFSDLPLAPPLLEGLKEAGFEHCTPIQAESLPPSLKGKDVAGQAQTGTGKTIAFLLACCNYLLEQPVREGYVKGEPRALILAPTRELAIQIHKDALVIAKHTDLSIGLVYGGTGYDQQKDMLAGNNDILIGTPGRLIDFYKQKLFTLKYAQVAVMDEADRMFDLGFIKDIRFLLKKMPEPEHRLNLLFSATLSFRVMELAYDHLNDPMQIKIDSDEVVADRVIETCYYPANNEKLRLLINLLNQQGAERTLVFVNTRHAAESVSKTLEANHIKNAMLSGDVPQTKREKLLEQFKQGKRNVLVATDVAARGLHIPAVSHVYNFDLPQDAEDYVHRIGRTARAGASGEAISFVCEKYAYSIMDIEQYIGHSLPRVEISETLLQSIERAPYESKEDRHDKKSDSARKTRRSSRKPESRSQSQRSNADTTSVGRFDNIKPEISSDIINEKVADTVISPRGLSIEAANKEENVANGGESYAYAKGSTQNHAQGDEPASSIQPTAPPPRFSRRFGEVPLVG